ncbi:hypothetical protein N9Y92_02325, partial [Chlamydiales bacterium]|nr:hypothetical protein [Chlamydiales bacterium]
PHLGYLPFDCTMRFLCGLEYSLGKITVRMFGAYWKIPKKSLGSKGSMNELHKSSIHAQTQVAPVGEKIKQEVKVQVERAMRLLYQEMLDIEPPL